MTRKVQAGETIVDSFPAIDFDGYSRVTGLSTFVFWVYRDGVADATPVAVSEIDSTGEYKIELNAGTASFLKVQVLIDYNKDIYEWEFDVRNLSAQDLEDHLNLVDIQLDELNEMIKRVLGLSQENVYIDNTVYDADSQLLTSRVRLYDTKEHCDAATDGGNETEGLLATYTQTTDWQTINQFRFYKQVKD